MQFKISHHMCLKLKIDSPFQYSFHAGCDKCDMGH